jgi:hypothetical protein
MKIKQVIEKEVDGISLLIEKPKDVSIYVTGKSAYDFIDLKLSGEDLKLSSQFCEMLKEKLIEKFS